MEIGDPLAHRKPFSPLFWFSLGRPEDLESGSVVDRRLDPEDTPLLVVHFDRVGVQTMFDPDTLGPSLEVAHHF